MHPFATPREAADGESVFERCEGAKERGPDICPGRGGGGDAERFERETEPSCATELLSQKSFFLRV